MTSWLIWQNCISVTWTRTTRERFLNSRMDVGSLEARLVGCLKPDISEVFLEGHCLRLNHFCTSYDSVTYASLTCRMNISLPFISFIEFEV